VDAFPGPQDEYSWRCIVGKSVLTPCYSPLSQREHEVVCAVPPWYAFKVPLIRLQKPVPVGQGDKGGYWSSWALQLSNKGSASWQIQARRRSPEAPRRTSARTALWRATSTRPRNLGRSTTGRTRLSLVAHRPMFAWPCRSHTTVPIEQVPIEQVPIEKVRCPAASPMSAVKRCDGGSTRSTGHPKPRPDRGKLPSRTTGRPSTDWLAGRRALPGACQCMPPTRGFGGRPHD
jgi:hypothetical protein